MRGPCPQPLLSVVQRTRTRAPCHPRCPGPPTATSVLSTRWGRLFPVSPPPRRCLCGTLSAAPGFLRNIPGFPRLKIGSCHPPAALHGGQAYAEFGNHLPMPCPDRVRPRPYPHRSGWTGHSGEC